jgi:hypothetical protein
MCVLGALAWFRKESSGPRKREPGQPQTVDDLDALDARQLERRTPARSM